MRTSPKTGKTLLACIDGGNSRPGWAWMLCMHWLPGDSLGMLHPSPPQYKTLLTDFLLSVHPMTFIFVNGRAHHYNNYI